LNPLNGRKMSKEVVNKFKQAKNMILTGDFALSRIYRDPLHVDRVCGVLGHAEGVLSKHGLDVLDDAWFDNSAFRCLLML
jgi:hypothetical protein